MDGAHIETLLLTFFFRYLRPLIDNGHLYLAVPPLYEIKYRKTREYAYSEGQRDKIVEEIKEKYNLKNTESITMKMFKGLGEMDPEDLFDTTMDRETRILKRVVYEDFLETDIIFTQLMGKEVKPRKKFIINNYKNVKVLDI
ncbi:MAG: hypothetical protein GF383_09305 [Candidatus Lokiarchaeota archaeon]|nr:hypothetical protein [Candidatus Lokiarchaeota archaeon]MBD3340710.1 hypothetical protein [Candidatus Lokiarchaeota archaeon]